MIEFATDKTEKLVRDMWKICFDDTEEFINLHFSHKYKPQNTLIYFEDGVATASLQMFEYRIRFYGEILSFYYLAGLCTLPEHRKKGHMAQLIWRSHEIMKQRNVSLAILVPAEDWLFGFYEKYGYERVFEGGGEVPLKSILDKLPDLESAYSYFDKNIQASDFCILKTYDDFIVIAEEARQDGFPIKYNLSGMACILDVPYLLSLYTRTVDAETSFTIAVKSDCEKQVYKIACKTLKMCPTNTPADINVDMRGLCRLLFGFKTSELTPLVADLFPEHRATMNLMME